MIATSSTADRSLMPKYDPPHGILDDLLTWSSEGMERNRRENEAYDNAWHARRGVEDYKDHRYSPPNGILDDLFTWSESGMKDIERENGAYDRGWNAAKAHNDASSSRK